MLGIMKHRVCNKDAKFDQDFNNFLRTKIMKLSLNEILSFISPRIYDINELSQLIGQYQVNTEIVMPNVKH